MRFPAATNVAGCHLRAGAYPRLRARTGSITAFDENAPIHFFRSDTDGNLTLGPSWKPIYC